MRDEMSRRSIANGARHDDHAGDKGGAGVTWSNGAHWRRVQSAPLQACGTPFPMVKDS